MMEFEVTRNYLFPFAAILAACSADEPATDMAEPAVSSQVVVEATGGNPAAETAASEITDPYMREIISEISSYAYEGLGPGSACDKKALDYLASRMEEL